MAINWKPAEKDEVSRSIAEHPVNSGRCAALAREVLQIGRWGDSTTRGRQVLPLVHPARFLCAKHPHARRWAYHVLVETHQHYVDALTGADGCDPQGYLEAHFEYPNFLQTVPVNPFTIDVGIQEVE